MDEHTHAQCCATQAYPVGNLQSLALRNLGALQSLFQPVQRLGVEGLGTGDDDLELTPVGSHEGVEVGKDLGRGRETAILGEDGEEVGEDGGCAGGDDGREGGGSLGSRKGGVFCTGYERGKEVWHVRMKAASFASSLIFLSKASTSFASASRSLGDFFSAAR